MLVHFPYGTHVYTPWGVCYCTFTIIIIVTTWMYTTFPPAARACTSSLLCRAKDKSQKLNYRKLHAKCSKERRNLYKGEMLTSVTSSYPDSIWSGVGWAGADFSVWARFGEGFSSLSLCCLFVVTWLSFSTLLKCDLRLSRFTVEHTYLKSSRANFSFLILLRNFVDSASLK